MQCEQSDIFCAKRLSLSAMYFDKFFSQYRNCICIARKFASAGQSVGAELPNVCVTPINASHPEQQRHSLHGVSSIDAGSVLFSVLLRPSSMKRYTTTTRKLSTADPEWGLDYLWTSDDGAKTLYSEKELSLAPEFQTVSVADVITRTCVADDGTEVPISDRQVLAWALRVYLRHRSPIAALLLG